MAAIVDDGMNQADNRTCWNFSAKIRVGHIHFVNCLPLTYSLEFANFGSGMDVKAAPPAVLNRMVIAGELDVTPVSSIIYAQNSDKLLLLPNLSISADGFVQSILLVSKCPIEELSGTRIALTAKSATSHGLLKIILRHAYKLAATPEYFITAQSVAEGVLNQAEAVLLIGDDALDTYYHRTNEYFYYDLGVEWKRFTGRRMVYAVWVVNREFMSRRPDLVELAYERITGGFSFGVANIAIASEALADRTPFNASQIVNYLNLINYGLTPDHCQALLRYYQLAAETGLTPGVPNLEFAKIGEMRRK